MDKTTDLKLQINNYILETLSKEEFKKNLSSFLCTEFKNLIIDKKDDFCESETYQKLQAKIKNEMINTINSSSFKKQISNLIDNNLANFEKSDKALEKIVPPVVINSLKVYIYNHKEDLINAIKQLLNSKDIDKRILAEINNAINGMNPMVARFVNVNNIYIKLKSSIDDYLNDSKNVMDIINFINTQLDILMKKKISEFSTYFPVEGRKALINSLTQGISNNLLTSGFIDFIFSMANEKLIKELSNLSPNSPNLNLAVNSFISSFMNDTYDNLLEMNSSKDLIYSISEGIVDNFLSKPLIDLI